MSNTNSGYIFKSLLAPSGASIVVSLFLSVLTVAITLYLTVLKGSEFEIYAIQLAEQPNDFVSQLKNLNIAINSSEFVGTLSIYVAWCVVGIILYALFVSLWHIIRGGALFVSTVRFLPEKEKPHIVVEVTEKLLLQLAGAAGLYGLFKLVLLGAIPVVYALQKLKIEPEILNILFSISITMIVTMVFMHALTVVLRLITLRLRLLF